MVIEPATSRSRSWVLLEDFVVSFALWHQIQQELVQNWCVDTVHIGMRESVHNNYFICHLVFRKQTFSSAESSSDDCQHWEDDSRISSLSSGSYWGSSLRSLTTGLLFVSFIAIRAILVPLKCHLITQWYHWGKWYLLLTRRLYSFSITWTMWLGM